MFLGNAVTTENCSRITLCVAYVLGVNIILLTPKFYISTSTFIPGSQSSFTNNSVYWQNTRQK